MTESNHKIVLVSGSPGVGKTSLAVPLAKALNFTLLSRDDIKETLYEMLNGRPDDREFSKIVGAASWEVLWKLAPKAPRVVLESNFRPGDPIERARLAALEGQIVEVHCTCPVEEIIRRYNSRDAEGRRHYAHALHEITPDQVAEFDGGTGFGTLIKVDTSHQVDFPALTKQIQAVFSLP